MGIETNKRNSGHSAGFGSNNCDGYGGGVAGDIKNGGNGEKYDYSYDRSSGRGYRGDYVCGGGGNGLILNPIIVKKEF